MDVWFVTWGGVLGSVLLALAATGSVLAMTALAMRRATPMGRFVRSFLRARRSLDGAEAGDRIVALGRVEVDGPGAERFDDGAPCALASLETEGGFATARGQVLYLRTRDQRMRLRGPVSIEATTRASRRWRPSMLLRLHLWRERLPAGRPVRVSSLSIGERALVVGRAEKDVAREGTTYRDAPLVLAIGAGDEPIAVLGLGHVGPALAGFALRAVAPALAFVALAAGLITLSVAQPDLMDALGGEQPRVPAHLALPLLSPWHRDDALRRTNAWLVESLRYGTQPAPAHLLEIASAMHPLLPSCAREAAVAVARPGHRSERDDGCDAQVGTAVSAAWASWGGTRTPEDRAALWEDVVTSVERAPEVGVLALTRVPPGMTEEDEWARVALVLRSPRPGPAMWHAAAIHLRRLAIAEALAGSGRSASLLADGADRYGSFGGYATRTALLALDHDAPPLATTRAGLSLADLRLDGSRQRADTYVEAALTAAELVTQGEHEAAYRMLAPHTFPRRIPRTRALVLAALEAAASEDRLADAN